MDSPEYFAVLLFALTTVVALGGTSMVNALISLFLGLMVATVGVDVVYGVERLRVRRSDAGRRRRVLAVMVGAYGLGEALTRLEKRYKYRARMPAAGKVATRVQTLREVWRVRGTLARSSAIGMVLGTIPGAGAAIASFVAYGTESPVRQA